MAIKFDCPHCGQVYRVDVSKAGSAARCKKCDQRITVPKPTERSADGTEILRHAERTKPFELATGDSERIEAISNHLESVLGSCAGVFHEIVSDLVHIDVHCFPATDDRDFIVMATTGMSDRPMTVPAGAEDFQFAELLICLPANWPTEQKLWKNESHYWPIRLLKMLARMPHEYETWLGPGHTVPNGDPPAAYAPNTKLAGALIAPPMIEGLEPVEMPDGSQVRFYAIIPLYAEEMDLKLSKGLDALLDALDRGQAPIALQVDRPNTAKRKRFFGLF